MVICITLDQNAILKPTHSFTQSTSSKSLKNNCTFFNWVLGPIKTSMTSSRQSSNGWYGRIRRKLGPSLRGPIKTSMTSSRQSSNGWYGRIRRKLGPSLRGAIKTSMTSGRQSTNGRHGRSDQAITWPVSEGPVGQANLQGPSLVPAVRCAFQVLLDRDA